MITEEKLKSGPVLVKTSVIIVIERSKIREEIIEFFYGVGLELNLQKNKGFQNFDTVDVQKFKCVLCQKVYIFPNFKIITPFISSSPSRFSTEPNCNSYSLNYVLCPSLEGNNPFQTLPHIQASVSVTGSPPGVSSIS